MTYHFNSCITRWLSTFKQRMRKNKLYSICQKYKHTVVLDLQTSNILISALPTIDQLISKTFLLKTRGTVYRKYLMQHHASGASKRWLISPVIPASAAKREKYEIRAVEVQTKKKQSKAKTVKAKYFSRRKEFFIIKVFPYQTVCFSRLTTLPSFAAGQNVVSQTPRGWWLVKCLRCCYRPSRLLVELAAKYSPPPGLRILIAETHPYWLQTR